VLRGRVGDDPAAQLREHLIDAAETLLSTRQVSTITTRELAREAGVSDGVLYNYFANKQDLLATALLRRYASYLTRFEESLPAPGIGTIEESLTALTAAVHELVSDTLPMITGLISDPDLQRRFISDIHQQPLGPQRMLQPVAHYLAAERDLGRIADVDLASVIHFILGPALVLGFSHVIGGVPREELTSQIPQLAHILIRGIAPSLA
jgi:AcrR family transcriptional regulator